MFCCTPVSEKDRVGQSDFFFFLFFPLHILWFWSSKDKVEVKLRYFWKVNGLLHNKSTSQENFMKK